MKARLLLGAIIVATAATRASGQPVRPESLSYMSQLFRLNEFGNWENPRYSRDGRWLAFDARQTNDAAQHIFVVAANGGTPIAVTTGTSNDARPTWTAAGDRLVFASSLTGGAMTIAIDPATGRAAGPVKRVSIDSVLPRGFDVAPDGKSVAYLTRTAPSTFELRVVSINGGPSTTLATVQGGADLVRFDRTGANIYYSVDRREGAPTPQQEFWPRDVKRIATAGGAPSTVLSIPKGLLGLQIDPIADRVIVRNGQRAHVLTLGGDSVATIAWAQGFRTVSHFVFTPDGSSLVTVVDASRAAVHVVPLDGGPVRAITDSSEYAWPDYWIGDHIFLDGRGELQGLVTPDGTRSMITFDLRKANDGVPLKVVTQDPFSDGSHYLVPALNAAGETSLFVYDSRTGEAHRAAEKVTDSRLWASGPVDSYSGRLGDEMLYRNVRNGVVEVHLLDVSGRDRIVQSVPLPKENETLALAPGRIAHAYQRGDTAYLDVTIGSGNPVQVLARPGLRMGELVFSADGSSLYADVLTPGTGDNQQKRGGFFSTVNTRSLAAPARWVDTGGCYHPTWLPSGAGVLEYCKNRATTRTWVAQIPATGLATPQLLTQRETATFYDYTMSPDGKYIAVPAQTNSGLTVWRVDLRAAVKAQH
jgi:hypothetical protein